MLQNIAAAILCFLLVLRAFCGILIAEGVISPNPRGTPKKIARSILSGVVLESVLLAIVISG